MNKLTGNRSVLDVVLDGIGWRRRKIEMEEEEKLAWMEEKEMEE
jgi:hypothetical protein